MGIVHTSQGGLSPASKNLRSEPWIVSSLATKTLDDSRDWMGLSNDYDKIRDLMASALMVLRTIMKESLSKRIRFAESTEDNREFSTPRHESSFCLSQIT